MATLGSAPAPASPDARPPAVASEPPLPFVTKVSYGAPSFAGAAMVIPIAIHLTIFYSDTILVPLGFIALVKATARSFDALTDPLMGWVSDRTRSRWGRRRPWMVVGAPLCALAFVAMFTPPQSLSVLGGAAWLATTYTLYYLFHTVYVIPHYGLGPELTLDYRERNTLFVYREAFVIAGTLCASVLPALLIGFFGTRSAYTAFALIFATLLTLLYVNLVARVRERPDFGNRPPNPLVPGVRRMMRNRPFRILLVVYVVFSVTAAIPGMMMPYYSKYILQPENPDLALGMLLAIYFAAGFVAMPFWLWAANRFGKKPTWLVSFLPGLTGGLMLYQLGPGDLLPAALILTWSGTGFSAGAFLGPSMQADVIDYDELYSGKRREAQYGGAWSVISKFVGIPSLSVPLAILATVGFVPNVEQSETVSRTISAIFCLAPATTSMIAFFVALFYPIDRRVHAEIWAGIEQHKRGQPATDPLTGKLVPPPRGPGVDEDASWFLDHFSERELRRTSRAGGATLVQSAALATGLSLAITVLAGWLTVREVSDLSRAPGLAAVLFIVTAGFGFTALSYHLIRLRAARRFQRRPPAPEQVKFHLSVARRLRRGGVELAPGVDGGS